GRSDRAGRREKVAPVVGVASQGDRSPEFRGAADEQQQHTHPDRRRGRLPGPERPPAHETQRDEAHRVVAHEQERRAAKRAAPGAAACRCALHVGRVTGAELRFVERGAGIPVVLVHGSLGTLENWGPQIDAFATRFRVIAYSRRYHWPNAAQPDGQGYSLSLHADDLIGLIEALGLERVHLVASSYGAYVALLVTLRRPDLVRSLVLAEPPLLPWLGRTPA